MIFCYTNPIAGTIERSFPVGQAPGYVTVHKVRYKRDVAAEHRGFRNTPGTWPMASDSAGCHPSQAQEYFQDSCERGVPTHFDTHGRAIFTSAAHRKAYCESRGIYDRNAGYGDPIPRGIKPPNSEYLA